MAVIPFWYPNPHQFDDQTFENPPNPWDYVALNGVVLPGIAKVKVGKGRKLDVKLPPASHGATITDRGYKPAPVEITLTQWTPSQNTLMQQLMSGANTLLSLEPKPNTSYQAPAYPIDHPATAMHGVTNVIIEDIEGPEDSSVKGAKEYRIKCLQFFPPPKLDATNTPKGTIAPQPNALTPTDPSTVPPSP